MRAACSSSAAPPNVPLAARAAAGALAAEGCSAAAAGNLLQQVPSLVHAQLAQHADQLVKVIGRQLAVHTRLTAGTPAHVAIAAPSRRAVEACSCNTPAAAAAAPVVAASEVAPLAASAAAGKPLCRVPAAHVTALRTPPVPTPPRLAAAVAVAGGEALSLLSRADSAASTGEGSIPDMLRARRRITPVRVEPTASEGNGTPSAPMCAALGSLATPARIQNGAPAFGATPPVAVEPQEVAAAATGGVAGDAGFVQMPVHSLPLVTAAGVDAARTSGSRQPPFGRGSRELKQAPPTTGLLSATAAPPAEAAGLPGARSPLRRLATPELAPRPAVLEHAFGAARDATRKARAPAAEAAAQALAHALAARGPLSVAEPLDALAAALAAADDRQWVAALCAAAARSCIAAAEAGAVSVGDVDQRLAQLLTAAAAEDAATGDAAGAWRPRRRDAAALVCGAALHAHVRSARHERAVWLRGGSGWPGPHARPAAGEGEGGMPRWFAPLVCVPATLMKAARGGAPLCVLRSLRLWLQATTLGDPRLAAEEA